MNSIILLTATVTPKGMAYTNLQDPLVRETQYITSLTYYLKNTSCQIIFCENTGYNLDKSFDKYIRNNRLEFLSFNGNNYDKSLGKGYGEALIIEYALEHSKFIQNGGDILLYKITGRIIIKNISQLLSKARKTKTIYTEYRRKLVDRVPSLCIAAPVPFYKYFVGEKAQINDTNGIYFEHVLKSSILTCRKEWSYKHKVFPSPVKVEGVSGSRLSPYKSQSYYKWFFCWWLHKYHTYLRHQ